MFLSRKNFRNKKKKRKFLGNFSKERSQKIEREEFFSYMISPQELINNEGLLKDEFLVEG